jgi:hypothetical protein
MMKMGIRRFGSQLHLETSMLRSLIFLFSLTHPLPAVHLDFANCLNDIFLTPLEKASERMRSEREFSETLLQTWDGYKDEDLILEIMLKWAAGMDISEGSKEYVKKRNRSPQITTSKLYPQQEWLLKRNAHKKFRIL